jgi:hypothetical protein
LELKPEHTLIEFAHIVSEHLERAKARPVLVGGAACSFWAPRDYVSKDADFCLSFTALGDDVRVALKSAGLNDNGAGTWIPIERQPPFSLDLLEGSVMIGSRCIELFHESEWKGCRLRVLRAEDSLMDRLLHCAIWKDLQSCRNVETLIRLHRSKLDWDYILAFAQEESCLPELKRARRRALPR